MIRFFIALGSDIIDMVSDLFEVLDGFIYPNY